MEVAGHLIFQIVKITILSSIYASIIVLGYTVILKIKQQDKSRKKKKILLWFVSAYMLGMSLFIFMLSHWGDHGLGDSARIPLKNRLAIENINWSDYGFIQGIKSQQEDVLRTSSFNIDGHELVGNLCKKGSKCGNRYFSYSYKNKTLLEFDSQLEYSIYASSKKLPSTNEFLTFEENYKKYWYEWRFWFLP